jgi:hypothetical protein
MQNVLVQTLLPPKLGAQVKLLAKAEGMSVSAWLRRLIMQINEPPAAKRKRT